MVEGAVQGELLLTRKRIGYELFTVEGIGFGFGICLGNRRIHVLLIFR